MDLQLKVSLHFQCKPRLIIASSTAKASSIITATRVVLIATPHSTNSRILRLKLAFPQYFANNQINSIFYYYLHLIATYLIKQYFVNYLIFHFNSIKSINFETFELCLISFN